MEFCRNCVVIMRIRFLITLTLTVTVDCWDLHKRYEGTLQINATAENRIETSLKCFVLNIRQRTGQFLSKTRMEFQKDA